MVNALVRRIRPALRRVALAVVLGGTALPVMAETLGDTMVAAYRHSALLDQQLDARMATTLAFLVLALAQLWMVFNMRDFRASPFLNDVTRNPWVWGALALCSLLLLAAVYTPLRTVMKLETPEPGMWLVALAASLVPLVVGQIGHEVARILAARKE